MLKFPYPERESSSSDGTSHTKEEEDTDQTIPMEVYKEEAMVTLGVSKWMMRNPWDGKVPGATKGGEEPQTMRATHVPQSPSLSVMRQG